MKLISDGQKFALIKLLGRFTKSRKVRLWMLSQLLNKEVETTSELFVDDWRKIRDAAYPAWPDDDWEIAKEFESKCELLYRRYEEEVLGQKSLF